MTHRPKKNSFTQHVLELNFKPLLKLHELQPGCEAKLANLRPLDVYLVNFFNSWISIFKEHKPFIPRAVVIT